MPCWFLIRRLVFVLTPRTYNGHDGIPQDYCEMHIQICLGTISLRLAHLSAVLGHSPTVVQIPMTG